MHLSLGLHIHALPMHDGWELNLLTNFTWNGRAQEALFLKEISTWRSVRVVLSLLEDITVHPKRKKGAMSHLIQWKSCTILCTTMAQCVVLLPVEYMHVPAMTRKQPSLYIVSLCGGTMSSQWSLDPCCNQAGQACGCGPAMLPAGKYIQTVAMFHSQQGVIAPAT